MALNLMHQCWRPQVSCSSVSRDGHGVDTLITTTPGPTSFSRDQGGFMTEPYLKPPVNVRIDFPFNVDLQRIVLNSKLGSQQSRGFEIYANAMRLRSTWLRYDDDDGALDTHATPTGGTCDKEIDRVYSCIGRGYDTVSSVVVFNNPTFRPKHPYDTLTPMTARWYDVGNDVTNVDLNCRRLAFVNACSHVIVRITRTKGSVCCLRWLEIWGQPSHICPRPVVDLVLKVHQRSSLSEFAPPRIHQQLSGSDENPIVVCDDAACTSSPPPGEKSPLEGASGSRSSRMRQLASGGTLSDDVTIPEEFFDPITQELMRVPMVLPSGQSVDIRTLERHLAAEAGWGRPPGDPFTGLPFNPTSKPVPSDALKVRIDKFVLTHGDSLNINGRRLGHANSAPSGGNRNSRLTAWDAENGKSNSSAVGAMTLTGPSDNGQLGGRTPAFNRAKDKALEAAEKRGGKRMLAGTHELGPSTSVISNANSGWPPLKKPRISHTSTLRSSSVFSPAKPEPDNVQTQRQGATRDGVDHSKQLESSLQAALNSTMGALQDFTIPSRTNASRTQSNLLESPRKSVHCVICPAGGATAPDHVYSLKCEHFLCRSCLLTHVPRGIDVFTCPSCERVTAKSDITRFCT